MHLTVFTFCAHMDKSAVCTVHNAYVRQPAKTSTALLARSRMIWLLPLPPPSPVSKLSPFPRLPVCRRSSSLTVVGGGGAKSYDNKKVWSSINHSILSGNTLLFPEVQGNVREIPASHACKKINIIEVNFFID